MCGMGLKPSEELSMIKVRENVVTGASDNTSPFYGHVLMAVDSVYRNSVSARLKFIQDHKLEGMVSLTAQALEGSWNFMVNIGASSLEAFELVGANNLFTSDHVKRTAVLLANSHYSGSGVPNTEKGSSAKESTDVVSSFILLGVKPGISHNYTEGYLNSFGVGKQDSNLNSATHLVTGPHDLMLEVVPQSTWSQDLVYHQLELWKEYIQDMRVYHIVPSSNTRGLFTPDVPRAYSLIKAFRSGSSPRLREEIEQLGDPSTIRAYRVLGRIDTDIIAAISLDQEDPHRVGRIHESIRMIPFVGEVSTFL